jgi:nicotinamidase-related amidase
VKLIYDKLVCETLEEVLNPDWCAVLSIDLQNDFMDPEGAVAQAGGDVSAMVELAPRCAAFLSAARALDVRIVNVRMIDLPGGQSDSPAWLRSKQTMAGVSGFAIESTWGAEFVKGCEPAPGELIVTKHRSSAFTATNLDRLLRDRGVQTVVVVGEQTPGCVEATYRDAAYHDYYNVLVEDCVAGRDRELHEASIMIQKARHDVVTAEQTLAIWRRYRAGELFLNPEPARARIDVTRLAGSLS